MFTKTREPEAVVVPPPQPLAPQSPAAPPKRTTRANGVPSIISAEVVVRGTLVSTGDVQVDGRIDGDVRANGLVIGEKAVVCGDVYAEEINVRGRIDGSICARRVQLCATCHVAGNILHESLQVEAGAFFEGNCRHSDNPLADAPDLTSPSHKPGLGVEHRKPAGVAHPVVAAKPAGDDGHARPAANFAPLKT